MRTCFLIRGPRTEGEGLQPSGIGVTARADVLSGADRSQPHTPYHDARGVALFSVAGRVRYNEDKPADVLVLARSVERRPWWAVLPVARALVGPAM